MFSALGYEYGSKALRDVFSAQGEEAPGLTIRARARRWHVIRADTSAQADDDDGYLSWIVVLLPHTGSGLVLEDAGG